jgi:predicted ribosomally synthesized peptide with nif11-like leader
MALDRDLIEAIIKCKRELLLPWRYLFLLVAVAPAALNQSFQHPWAPVALGCSFGVMAMGVATRACVLRHPADTRLQAGDTGGQHTRPLKAMSEEQLKGFLEAVKADAGLQEQLKAAADTDAVVALANTAGFAISVKELQSAQAEISEGELEGVVGGKFVPPMSGWF